MGAGHVLNFVIYRSTTGDGDDEVLQHKVAGAEMAHITLHPAGSLNLRERRSASRLREFVAADLAGFSPLPSGALRQFLSRVRNRI
jgi:hypothetical protein